MSEAIHYRQTDPANPTLCGLALIAFVPKSDQLANRVELVDCRECREILGADRPDPFAYDKDAPPEDRRL